MEIKGINELKKVLEKHNGEDAVISISYKIYTDKKIECRPEFFIDERRIGFRIKKGQEIYIYRNELQNLGIDDEVFFEDNEMRVNIKFK